ncbi:MAG: hypothetical protein QJR14_07190 [Bacillota bacterium]|nr:hypothetical protein [Bacillota bacterium]
MSALRSVWFRRGWPLLVTLVVVAAVATVQPVQTAAQSFLDLFHAKRLQPITLDPQAFRSLPEPGSPDAFGSFHVTGGQAERAASPGQAQALLGETPLDRLTAAGWRTSGDWQVTGAIRASLTLDRAKLESYLRQAGWGEARLPAALDGATFRADVPPVVISVWQGPGDRSLTLFQGAQPRIEAPAGLDPAFLQQLVLRMPGLPENLRRQLQSLGDWRNTLPVPVPEGTLSQPVRVPGASDALYLSEPDTGQAVLLWLEPDGSVLALRGQGIGRDELLTLAATVRPQ